MNMPADDKRQHPDLRSELADWHDEEASLQIDTIAALYRGRQAADLLKRHGAGFILIGSPMGKAGCGLLQQRRNILFHAPVPRYLAGARTYSMASTAPLAI